KSPGSAPASATDDTTRSASPVLVSVTTFRELRVLTGTWPKSSDCGVSETAGACAEAADRRPADAAAAVVKTVATHSVATRTQRLERPRVITAPWFGIAHCDPTDGACGAAI